MTPTFTIYCASSSTLAPIYTEAATHLAAACAKAGIDIVTGGGYSGLMGAVADAALAAGGRVTGVIPRFMEERGWHHRNLSDMKIVDSMHTRKRIMAEMATAAIALPGGVGTFEELMEIITWRQLGLFKGNVVIYNVNNYYGPLLSMFDTAIGQGFMRPDHRTLFTVAESVEEVMKTALAEPDTHVWTAKF